MEKERTPSTRAGQSGLQGGLSPETLRAMRKAANLDQKALAGKLDVTRSAIGHYERGARTISPQMFQRWAEACGFQIKVEAGEAA